MNRSGNEQVDRLERALAHAHAAQEPPEFSPAWMSSVMRDIRLQANAANATVEVPHLVWRAATVVVLVTMVMIGSLLAWDTERVQTGFFTDTTLDATLL